MLPGGGGAFTVDAAQRYEKSMYVMLLFTPMLLSCRCCWSGSRSSPLALTAASHPRSQLTVAIDERSLGFWALGYSRANPGGLPAAVICSSGTAVANLLPAVVEASQSNVPLLLLTGDRPYDLRDTGSNQTIDQVKIFGGYTRWASDVCPPSEQLPGRVIVSTVDTAVRFATAAPRPGPVHLNFQFREPLAPSAASWSADRFLQGLQAWQWSAEPYTTVVNPGAAAAAAATSSSGPMMQLSAPAEWQQQWHGGAGGSPAAAAAAAAASPELHGVLQLLAAARRGLIVVGEQSSAGAAAAAAMQLAAVLGWPVAADILSGLRVGSQQQQNPGGRGTHSSGPGQLLLHHFDHVLLGGGGPAGDLSWWCELQPDVILQLGPRVTSKRINQFMVRTSYFLAKLTEGTSVVYDLYCMAGRLCGIQACSKSDLWFSLHAHTAVRMVLTAPCSRSMSCA